jgi:ABC-2 type transport system permease protein
MKSGVLAVAKWEFFRFFKWRDQLIGVVTMLVTAALGFGVVKFAQSSNEIKLAVLGKNTALTFPEKSKIKIVSSEESMEQLKSKLVEKTLDGILTIKEKDNSRDLDVELTVRQEPGWLSKLQLPLNEMKTRREIEKASVTPEALQRIFEPQTIRVVPTKQQSVSTADKIAAAGMGSAMLLVSFLGLSFFMVGITGEKQQRITEQVVSAISAQTWIDGKLIGLTAASFASAGSFLLAGLAVYVISWIAGYGIPIPDSLNRWDLLPVFSVLFLGGAIFWNCFFAAVSSTINDPNTSAKSGLLFAPMLPVSAGLLALPQPEGMAMRVLSLLPGTSSTAMPIRLLIGEVAWWELAVCLLALAGGVFVLRLIAGRIFAAGIMLYGKEPSWLEIFRWALRG